MSLFGKKEASQSKPSAPALNVPSSPPVPPASNPSATPAGGRKRITQRLVLGGKGGDSGSIGAGGGATGLKLPGAPDPVTSQSVPMAMFTGTVDVPVENLLGSVPAEFVVSDHESLYQSPLAKEPVKLPLNVVLPLLPSGKIEVLAQDLYSYMPQGVMKSAEELGEYALSPVSLPLPEVISRIPEGALTLRSDQKPIDSSVTGMDDPFSAEMLAAAQEEALRAQAEAQGDTTVAEAPVEEESSEPTETIPGFATPPVEVPEAPPEPVAEPEPQPEPEPVPEPPVAVAEPAAEPDLSFAKSPEYQEMLKKLEEEAAQEQAAEPAAVPPAPAAVPEAPVESTTPVPPLEDFTDTEVTKIIPKADKAPGAEEPELEENPLVAPTRIMEKPEPAAVPQPPAPAAFNAPEPAAVPEPPAVPEEREAPAFSFKAPPQPPSEPQPQPAQPDPTPSESAYQVSGKLAQLLGIRGSGNPTLKDIVHQVNAWPGMKGCIVGGKDGLRISSEVEDDDFANSISAFAPKLIATISELFNDLGFDDVEEMHTPIRDSSVYIFRKQDLYMIVLFEDTSFPESYRNRIKQVMAEISSAN